MLGEAPTGVPEAGVPNAADPNAADRKGEEQTPELTTTAVPPRGRPDPIPAGDLPQGGEIYWTHGLVNRLVKLSDGALLALAGLLAWLVGPAVGPDNVTFLKAAVLTVVGVDVSRRAMEALGCYRVENYGNRNKALVDLFGCVALAGAAIAVLILALEPEALERSYWFEMWGGIAALLLAIGRDVAARQVRGLTARGDLRRRVVVFGATPGGERMIRHLREPAHQAEYEIVGLFDDRGADRRPAEMAGIPVSGDLADFKSFIQEHRVDMIVLALPWHAALRIHGLFMQLQMISVDILIPLEDEDFRLRFARIRRIGDAPALLVMRQPLKGMQTLIKRVEDIVVATVGLFVVSPVMMLAAIAIRLDSPGPIIFRQVRVGFNDRPFTMLKFRTMLVDERDDGSVGTSRDNPRITRVGAFLRRSSIDELPQLFNVLAGDMSVVGPRAHVPNMLVSDRRYADAVREYAARCRVKPGITGWGQINGMRGGIHSIEKARAGVELDIHYIENWSLWFDLKIMLSTITTGLFGRDVF